MIVGFGVGVMPRSAFARLIDSLFARGAEKEADRVIKERDRRIARGVAARFSRGNVLVQEERFETADTFDEKVATLRRKRKRVKASK